MDSLYQLGDYRVLYVLERARFNNEREHRISLDSLSRLQLAMCDTIVRRGFTQQRTDATAIASLENQKKNRGLENWGWRAVAVVMAVLFIAK